MKSLIPLTVLCAVVLSSCASPEARQREEARERLEEQKERDKDRAEEVEDARRRAAEDARNRTEDIADARRRGAEEGARYRAYEEEYARQLGKKPSQLTPSERQWVRDHF